MAPKEEKSQLNLQPLISSAIEGERDAFHQIYMLLSDNIYRYIVSRIRNHEEAKDILQDVFFDLWKGFGSMTYISDAHFYGFLFTVTKRKIWKHYTYVNRKVERETNIETTPIVSHNTSMATYDSEQLYKTVRTMRKKQREIIELRYWGGFSFVEIAHMVNRSESAVRVAHHRALKKLEILISTRS